MKIKYNSKYYKENYNIKITKITLCKPHSHFHKNKNLDLKTN